MERRSFGQKYKLSERISNVHIFFLDHFDRGHIGRICHILCLKAYLLGSYKALLEYMFFRVNGRFLEPLYNLPEKMSGDHMCLGPNVAHPFHRQRNYIFKVFFLVSN